MTRKTIFLILLSALFVVSCDSSGSRTSSGTAKNDETKNSTSEQREKLIGATRNTKILIQIPAVTLISRALLDDGVNRSFTIFLKVLRLQKDVLHPVPPWDERIGQAAWVVESGAHKPQLEWKDKNTHDAFKTLFACAMKPFPTWTQEPTQKSPEEVRLRATAILFTAAVFERLALDLVMESYSDQQSAIKAIKANYRAISEEDLAGMLQEALELSDTETHAVLVDTVTGKDVQFQVGQYTFVSNYSGNFATGITGKIWGDGWLNGQQLNFSLEKGTVAALEKRKTLESGQTEQTQQETKTGVEVQ